MIESIVAVGGLVVGFLIALGWYKRGLSELEKDVSVLCKKVEAVEIKNELNNTTLEVTKTKLDYMEAKIDDIHRVIMKPTTMIPTIASGE